MRRNSAWSAGLASSCGLVAIVLSVLTISPCLAGASGRAAVLTIDGAIGPATAEYVTQQLSTLLIRPKARGAASPRTPKPRV